APDDATTLAPDFTGVTATGETVSLSDFAGQTVVLEWTNDGCPFVKKHYAVPPANMQGLQTDAFESDVVWLSIVSSAPGKQGHRTGAELLDMNEGRGATPAHVIIDESGDIGRLYKAKTTPHMFVITAEGEIAYQGAIDDTPSARVSDIETSTNYVSAAMQSVAAGEPVEVASSKPYGCSVKY
ncbi:redoxin family protein, partial [Hyphomonas atlantica]|uniref:redoxin family protein n=1 Tax=Hyphomonas atlantica TaxID=1280948 RepID=UPI0032B1B8B7